LRGRRRDKHAGAVLAGEASAAAADVEVASAPPPADPRAAAFFDIDNTIMVGASIYHLARGLAARKYLTSRDLLRFGWQQVVFRVGGAERAKGMATARESALLFVAGREVDEINRLGGEIYDETMSERIYGGTLAIAQQHLAAGRRVWLVTATPIELATLIAHRLGFTGALGTVAELEGGRYTGKLVGDVLHGPAKAEALRALAGREGLDLARCYAYSDSANDLPMLTCVGHPEVINPDAELKRVAKERGWPVHDFRGARRVARVGIPIAAGGGATAGAVSAAVWLGRRHRGHGHPRRMRTLLDRARLGLITPEPEPPTRVWVWPARR